MDVEDLFYMLKQKPKVLESPDAKEFNFSRGSIEFRDVSFGHKRTESRGDSLSGEEQVDGDIKYLFQNLNLRIEAGTTNAFVGPSGFGKTSMLHLLFRIYDPNNGEILIDG